MFKYDVYNRPEPETFYLCQPDGTLLCELNGIDADSASIKVSLNNQYTLSFDYDRWINTLDGELVESNGYFDLTIEMRIFVKSLGYFVLKYPPYEYDGDRERKSVTAYSCECELEKKDLVGFKINTGETDSLEYLVVYDDDEDEQLLNAYTGLPYDYIMFDNTFPAQLQELYGKYSDGATITNSTQVADIKSYCDLITRLKCRLIPETIVDADGDEYEDYELIEFVEYTYDDDGNVKSIYLFPADSTNEYQVGFNGRIQQLITFYTKYHDQLSLIPLAIEKCNCNWSVGEIDPSLANKKFQFSIDSENIYSFLTNDIASVANCVFMFDLFNKVVSAVLVENIGVDSGVVLARESLLNSVNVSCNDDNLFTRYNVSGADDLTITQVNFGSSRIDDLTYFLNVRDDNGNLIYVTDELAAKYYQFAEDREIARDAYVNYTKEYNQLLIDIDELKYRVPNDVVQTDWDTFTLAELEEALTTYKNLLATVVSLYKEDYGSAGVNSDGSVKEQFIKDTMYWYDYYAYQQAIEQIEVAYEAKARNETYADIDNETVLAEINAWETEWSLYGTVELQNKIEAYTNQMKVLIDGGAVITKYPPTADYNGTCVTQGTSQLKQISVAASLPSNLNGVIIGVDFSFKHSRDEGVYFEFDWSNGSVSTQSSSYASSQKWTWFAGDKLYFKFTSNSVNSLSLIEDTGEIYSWDELDDDQQMEYSYMSINYHYTEYMEAYNLRAECQAYLDTLLVELEDLQDQLAKAQENRTALVNLTTIEGYDRTALGKLVNLNSSSNNYNSFTSAEIQTISMLYMDVDYSNENIITTSLDTVVTAIDAQLELLDDAREQLSIASQPQITFTVGIDNLLAMAEFRNFDFTVGNYTVVEYYDNYMVKLRLYEMTYNPCIPENDLSVTFTNFIKSRSERTDLSYILGSVSGGGSGGGSGGSGVTYGADIDATISDTMLAQLLNSETFGTRVSNIILDTIDVNSLYSRTATFGGLGNGFTKINGNCIQTGYIVSENYNGTTTVNSNGVITNRTMTNTIGSIINLNDGTFNFGGKKLTATYNSTYDTYTVTIQGIIEAEEGHIGGFTIGSDSIYSSVDGFGTTSNNVYVSPNGISLGTYFTVTPNGVLTAKRGYIGGWEISDNYIRGGSESYGSTAIVQIPRENDTQTRWWVFAAGGKDHEDHSDCKFRVGSSGVLYAEDAHITGAITATSGTFSGTITAGTGSQIGGWYVTNGKICAGVGTDGLNPDGSTGTADQGVAVMQVPGGTDGTATNVFAAGHGKHSNYGDCEFRVTKAGKLYSTDATIDGAIKATSFTVYDKISIYNTQRDQTDTITSYYDSESYGIQIGGSSGRKVYIPGSLCCNEEIIGSSLDLDNSLYVSGTTTCRRNVTVDNTASSGASGFWVTQNWSGKSISLQIGDGGENRGIYDNTFGAWQIYDCYSTSDLCNETRLPVAADDTRSGDANVYMGENGRLRRITSSSSILYKDVIGDLGPNDIEKYYSLPVHWFKYKEDYLKENDERYNVQIPGFIAEEWDELLPVAVDHNENGQCEVWNSRIVTPIMFEMIKYNHLQIESNLLSTTSQINILQSQIDSMQVQLDAAYDKIAKLEKEIGIEED